ncbi:uncharacterized protein LOC141628125 [Silene latifolia]|uniref:uncharacterized protein LOC141628125 n=1 Tax=Silene latifolia TaxID=37657 RepID=UPI003D7819B1
MSTLNSNQGIDHNFGANLRIYHGGHFVTKRYKTEYVKGNLMLKFDESEICYFDLMHIVKNELKIEDGEIWFVRQGLSLFAGRKKSNDDKDIESLMATKDKEGFIELYVVHGQKEKEKEKERQEVVNDVGRNQIIEPTHSLTIKEPTFTPQPNIPLNKSLRSKIPFVRPHKTLHQTKTRQKEKEIVESVGNQVGEEDTEDESDEDVVLSEADFDDAEDDDLFFENVDEDVLDEGNLNGRFNLEEDEDGGRENKDDGIEDEDDGIEFGDSGSEEAELLSDEDELGSDNGSDGEVEVKFQYPTFNPLTDFQRPIQLTLGLKFPSNTVFRKAVRHHAIENGYDYFFCHNNRKRVCIYCRYRCKCPWLKGRARLGKCKCDKSVKKCRYRLNATKVPGEETFQIMGLRLDHICGWNDINPKLSAEYLAERYLDYFRIDPE